MLILSYLRLKPFLRAGEILSGQDFLVGRG